MSKSKTSEHVISFRRRLKQSLVFAFGDKCKVCDKSFPFYVYDFHHIAPEEKSFGISSSNTTRSKKAVAEEAKKCVMLCANCHRIVEYAEEAFDFESDFNENLFYQKIDELNGTVSRLKKKEAEAQKKLLLQQNKPLRPSKEELKVLLRTLPMVKIGQQYGVSDNAVRKWAKNFNLPNKKSDIIKISDKEWECL